MIMWIELLGCIAGGFTSLSYIPQLLKLLKEKKSCGVSIHTYMFGLFGSMLWVSYGIINNTLALIFFNIFNVFVATLIIYFIYKYRFNELNISETLTNIK